MRIILTLLTSVLFVFSSTCIAEPAAIENEAITGEVAVEQEDIFDTDCCQYDVYYGKCVKDKSQPNGLRCRPDDNKVDRNSCTDFYPHNTSMKTCDEKNRNPPPVGNCKEEGKVAGSDCRTATATIYMKDASCDGSQSNGGNGTFKCIPKKKSGAEEVQASY